MSDWRRLFVLTSVLLAIGSPAVAQDPFPSVSSDEILLNESLPLAGNPDSSLQAFSQSDDVCMLALENFQVRALRSEDGGQTYGADIEVGGGQDSGQVVSFVAALSADGVLYAVLAQVDAAGGVGLSVVSSHDLCRSWTNPVAIVQNGDPAHGVDWYEQSIDTGPPGVVAVAYRRRVPDGVFATVTRDGGATWTEPAKLNANPGLSFTQDVVVDDTDGRVWVGFVEQFPTGQPCSPCSFPAVSRSSDLGVSFGPPTYIDFFPDSDAFNPQLLLAEDGGLLLTAMVVSYFSFTDHVLVVRSVDDGQSFQLVHSQTTGSVFDIEVRPRLTGFRGDSTVLLTYRDSSPQLVVSRSTSHGAAFAPPQPLSGPTAVQERVGDFDHDVARTAAGNWVVAWRDSANQSESVLDDINARSSTDGGATWGPVQRVNTLSNAPGGSHNPVVATTDDDGIVVGFLDSRGTGGLTSDVLVNTSTAASLSFGPDMRVDTDLGLNRTGVDGALDVASDGVSRVHAVFLGKAEGSRYDLFVASSTNGGRSFAEPRQVSTEPAGSRILDKPRILATPDGHVYTFHFSTAIDGGSPEIRFNRSTDSGASWLGSDRVLGTPLIPSTRYATFAASDGGRVWVAWVDQARVLQLARSFDGGASFTTEPVDDGLIARDPELCAAGDQLFLAFTSSVRIYARTSTDGGISLSAPTEVSNVSGADDAVIDCLPGGKALLAWRQFTSEDRGVRASRYEGFQWSAPVVVAPDAGPDILFSSDLAVAYTDTEGMKATIAYPTTDFATNSGSFAATGDGGVTFSAPQLLSDGETSIFGLRLVSDRAGNAWASWRDLRPYGALSPVVRRSTDGGLSFGAVQRLETVTPAGSFRNTSDNLSTTTAALPGAGLFIWAGQRSSTLNDAVFNVDDVFDTDRDGKVAVCHVPPGNNFNAFTIVVGAPAIPAHLAHGDFLGGCPSSRPEDRNGEESTILVTPTDLAPKPGSDLSH